ADFSHHVKNGSRDICEFTRERRHHNLRGSSQQEVAVACRSRTSCTQSCVPQRQCWPRAPETRRPPSGPVSARQDRDPTQLRCETRWSEKPTHSSRLISTSRP